jgi:hypothetical protein
MPSPIIGTASVGDSRTCSASTCAPWARPTTSAVFSAVRADSLPSTGTRILRIAIVVVPLLLPHAIIARRRSVEKHGVVLTWG